MDKALCAYYLITRLLGQHAPWQVDATFVFGRAKGDWEAGGGDSGLLEKAAQIQLAFPKSFVCIPGTPGGATHDGPTVSTTYPGPEVWFEYLKKLSVPSESIIQTAPAPVHTRGDSDAFINLCKERKWGSVAVIMQPHQVLRAMLAILASFKDCEYTLQVFPICPHAVNWGKRVYGSQGANDLRRREHQALEWERILDQQTKGFLGSFEELDEYLTDLNF